jgi:hypothetical protein
MAGLHPHASQLHFAPFPFCTLLLFSSLSLHSLPTASQPLGFYGLCSNGHCDCIAVAVAVAVAVAAIIVAVVVELLLQSHDDFDLSSCALCDTLSLSLALPFFLPF